jgi:diguanylate cyclase (GGDEF)-like protein/PAS domain S-box-containing protein
MSCWRLTSLTGRLARSWRGRGAGASRTPSASGADRHALEIRAEQIRLLFEQLPASLLATTVVGGLVVYVLWGYAPRLWLMSWVAALGATTLGRVWLLRAYFRARPQITDAARWARRFIAGVVLSGVIWGIAGVFPLAQDAFLQQMFLALVLAGLSAGGMSTLSSYRGAYAAFLVPAIVPFAIRLTMMEGEVFMAMSAMLVLFIAMMSLISMRHYRSVSDSLHLRFDKIELLDDLAAARDHQQAINDALQAQIDERRRTEAALQATNEVYRTLVETTGTGYHIADADGCVLDANAVYVGLTGHRSLPEIKGRPMTEWTAAYDVARTAKEIEACRQRGYVRSLEIDYVDAQGRITPIEINASVVTTLGAPRFLCLSRDISERKAAERALRRAYDDLERKVQERTGQLARANEVLSTEKELFRITLASIGDAVITTDAAAHITYLNTVAEQLTGWTDAQARGRPLTEVFRILDENTREPADDPVAQSLNQNERGGPGSRRLLICRDQRELNIDMSLAPIRDSDDNSIGVVLVFRDVTEESKLTQQLSHQATHDLLTGLVNRHEFERRLSHLLSSASPYTPHALLYLDLDQFKVVNDTCGHAAGDDLLRQISALLRTKLRARDTLARLGGDEFGVLLEYCSIMEAKRIANSLRELVQGFRFGWQDKSFNIGVSIGLVPLMQPGETLAGVFSAADSACYAAKEKGRNRVHLYKPDDSELAQRDGEMRWMPRIQQALADGRFRLYYQPIIAFGKQAVDERQGEILLRMVDEAGHIVLPGAFLPAAERYGLMPALDRWVVRTTLEALSASVDSGADTTFAINISGRSLGTADFLDFVTEQIDATQVAPRKLCFEITETSAISELAHALHFIDTLKTLGCHFALDDFGTGLSSFSYLKSLPVDYLKIDGGFVRGLVADNIDHAMVEAVNNIGHIMGLKTIAEWVENDTILLRLRHIGVDYAQGYALGEPRPLHLH